MSDFLQEATAMTNTGGGDRKPRENSEQSLLIDVHDMASMLACSARHVWRMADAGKMPRPHKLGALRRWDRSTIENWIQEGCPSCRAAVAS